MIVDKKAIFIQKDLLHFIFPILFLIVNIYVVNTTNPNPNSFHYHFVFYLILFLYNSTYCFLGFLILNKNIWNIKRCSRTKSKDEVVLNNWTLFLFILQIINTIRLLISLYVEYSYNHFYIIGDRFQWITSVVWIAIFIKILISPEILYGYEVLSTTVKAYKFTDLSTHSEWVFESNPNLITVKDLKMKRK